MAIVSNPLTLSPTLSQSSDLLLVAANDNFNPTLFSVDDSASLNRASLDVLSSDPATMTTLDESTNPPLMEEPLPFTISISDDGRVVTLAGSSGAFVVALELEGVSSSVVTVAGTAGNDVLLGSSVGENLVAGEGDDVLIGGLGNDRFVGGLGTDAFVIGNPTRDRRSDVDVITDFQTRQDLLVIDQAAFPKLQAVTGRDGTQRVTFANVQSLAEAGRSASTLVYVRKGRFRGSLFYNENGQRAGFGRGREIADLRNNATLNPRKVLMINSAEQASPNPPSAPPSNPPGGGTGGTGGTGGQPDPFNANPFYSPQYFGFDAFNGGRPLNVFI